MATKFIATKCEFRLHEDSWTDGEGKFVSAWDEADCIKEADSIVGILEQVNYLRDNFEPTDIYKTFEHSPSPDCYGRFDGTLLVDVDGDNIIKPTEARMQLFRDGKITLYSMDIVVKVKNVVGVDEDDIPTQFAALDDAIVR